MERNARILLLAVTLILIPSFPTTRAAEDKDEQVSIVTLVITPACKLDIIDSKVSKTISADSGASAFFSEGFVELDPNKPTLIIDSNNKWKLSVRSTDFTGPYSKEAADLMLKDLSSLHVNNSFTDYRPLSASDQDVAMYAGGVKDEEHPIQYKILIDWEKDIPGTYEATITYTLSTIGS